MVTIQDVRVIVTAPQNTPLVIVKVETSEAGLHGVGCATFTQRFLAVKAAIEEHVRPLVIRREVDRIEEIWQLMHVNGYWRNGPIMNNAMSGIDMALWDIKGKRAGMPVYDLLGGKVREAAAVYRHPDGSTPEEIVESVEKFLAEGVRHMRVQMGGYGGRDEMTGRPDGALEGMYFHPQRYMRAAIKALSHVRGKYPDLEIMHDVHSRLAPAEAVAFAKEVEPLRLFFLEDLLAPEEMDWLENVRAVTTTPLAMGELFNHPREWVPLMTHRRIDFMRMHVSQMGGITPARKAAILGEAHGVRTAWHGPHDTSPVGHAANVHLDVSSTNFGIQEFAGFNDAVHEVFPGAPEQRGGYLYPNTRPGLGIELNEKAAAKYPCGNDVVKWTQLRRPDGGLGRP
jgi:mannonate dehydratase